MHNNSHDELIENILKDYDKLTQILQTGIREALKIHKRAGNPVCGWRDGKNVWISPEEIPD